MMGPATSLVIRLGRGSRSCCANGLGRSRLQMNQLWQLAAYWVLMFTIVLGGSLRFSHLYKEKLSKSAEDFVQEALQSQVPDTFDALVNYIHYEDNLTIYLGAHSTSKTST